MKTGKRGFSSVFLTMIFGTLIMLTFAFIQASANKAMESSCDAVFSLAGQSVLTEFDLTLKESYGLIALNLNNADIENRLSYYANSTFKGARKLNMIPMKLEKVEVDLKDYSMIHVDNFEKAVTELMKFNTMKNLIGEDDKREQVTSQPDRILRNNAIIENLPSKDVQESGLFTQLIFDAKPGDIQEALKKGTRVYLVNSYIFERFRTNRNSTEYKGQVEPFFNNEIEYILYGKFSDEENRKKFSSDFIKLRTAFNLAHIYTDEVKMKEITALAGILTPGPGAVATQAVIAAAWAYAEAWNDDKLLKAEKKVALIKNGKNWALGIDSYERTQGDFIEPMDKSGYNYQEYLKIFIYMEDREVKLLRMMDLIQINLIGKYDEDFLMRNCVAGFKTEAEINGKKFNYVQQY